MSEHLQSLNISEDFLSVGVSGVDSTELLRGRPYGGCGILYRKSLAPHITRINSNSKRFCALSISKHTSTFITFLINVYLPTDYGTSDSNQAFLDSITELKGFISAQSFDNLIICGDFNVDFSRHSYNRTNLEQLMSSTNLVRTDNVHNVHFTYRKDDHSCVSWPDHVLTSKHHSHLVKDVACTDEVSNFSDHLPLSFNLDIDILSESSPFPSHPKVDWSRFT